MQDDEREDVTDTLRIALEAPAERQRPAQAAAAQRQRPVLRLGGTRHWLEDTACPHTRGRPYHPKTQGKIERWHRTLKNRILLENYYLPGDLERAVADFINHYNTGGTTRAWTTSHPRTSTSGGANEH